MPDNKSMNIEPRISALETSVQSLTSDVHSIAASVDKLREVVSSQSRPQWGNLIAAVAVGVTIITSIGSSFIAPIKTELDYHDRLLTDRGLLISTMQDRLRAADISISTEKQIREQTDEDLRREFNDVRDNGSPITRERLAVLELQIKQGRKPLKK